MEILHRHGIGLCGKCPSRLKCKVLCSEADSYADQDDTTTQTDALNGETVAFDDNKKMCELDVTVIDSIQALDPTETAVIVMKYYGGLNGNSIGGLLGFTRSGISRILKRALGRIEKEL